MDTVQVILGNLLLLLAELAAISFAVILLLLQANLIVWLAERLARSWRRREGDGMPTGMSPTGPSYRTGVPKEHGG